MRRGEGAPPYALPASAAIMRVGSDALVAPRSFLTSPPKKQQLPARGAVFSSVSFDLGVFNAVFQHDVY